VLHVEAMLSPIWYPTEDVELKIGYDLKPGRLLYGGKKELLVQ
jgi:hypothetical protein